MASVKKINPKSGDQLVLVGTTKGAFLFHANPERKNWRWSGPHFPGQAVYSLAYDGRSDRRRLFAGVQSMHFGAVLCSSDNFGGKWKVPEEANVRFPEGSDLALKNIWQITVGAPDEPDTLYAGVEPACLFVSRDAGKNWEPVNGFLHHPHRPRWEPGGGGLCLHTVLPDPRGEGRMICAISTGGVYRTDDGGASWYPKNNGVQAEFLPDKFPEFGQCVHKIARPASKPDRLYLQNHWGLYRSQDGAEHWEDMANGVPSTFGFPVVVHPHDPDTAYILPLESDMFRIVPERKLRVYRTQDGGNSWLPMTKGLPQKEAYEVVLRDAMAADNGNPAGIYFGTRAGSLYGSADDGESWKAIHKNLPPITCVKTAHIG